MLSLSQMLARNQSLQQLGLSKHGMVDSQLDTLVTYGLLRNTTLTSLDLKANRLSAFAGARSVFCCSGGRKGPLPNSCGQEFMISMSKGAHGRLAHLASRLGQHPLHDIAQLPPHSLLARDVLAQPSKGLMTYTCKPAPLALALHRPHT